MNNLRVQNVNLPFFVRAVTEHITLKDKILDKIHSMGTHCIVEPGEQISNTDWHLSSNRERPYWDLVSSVAYEHLNTIGNYLYPDFQSKCTHINNYWFQQYLTSDFQDWHTHNMSFSNVYFVELSQPTQSTTFRLGGTEFQVEVREGEILTFPGFVQHTSKPNKGAKKTVVVFNSSWN